MLFLASREIKVLAATVTVVLFVLLGGDLVLDLFDAALELLEIGLFVEARLLVVLGFRGLLVEGGFRERERGCEGAFC